jgi:hypothetical protein
MVDVSDVPGQEAVAEAAQETTTAPAPPAIKRQVEQWAESKGMLPEFFPGPPAHAGAIPLGTRRNPEFWRYAAARGLNGWVQGAEVTEAEFDAAVEQATTGTVMR